MANRFSRARGKNVKWQRKKVTMNAEWNARCNNKLITFPSECRRNGQSAARLQKGKWSKTTVETQNVFLYMPKVKAHIYVTTAPSLNSLINLQQPKHRPDQLYCQISLVRGAHKRNHPQKGVRTLPHSQLNCEQRKRNDANYLRYVSCL